MAKSKSKGKKATSSFNAGSKPRKSNPFEVKVVRTKNDTLNTKVRKFQKSAPNQSRSRAKKMRDETLGKEFKNRLKRNNFVDARLSSKQNMSEEAMEVEKFAKEAKRRVKSELFHAGKDLEQDVMLTHRGKSISDMERMESPVQSDDEDPTDSGHLTEQQTEALFGGGVFDKKRDHKEIMLDVIAKSKKHKFERQQQKEAQQTDFEKLDSGYSDILKLTSKMTRTNDDKYEDKKELGKDSFQRLMREMTFEGKIQPGQRAKTQAEILEAANKERLERITAAKARMKDDEEEVLNENQFESVETIHQKTEERKEVEAIAYSMETGELINHREELSEALRNIRKTESDDDMEDAEEDDLEESGDENTEECGSEEEDSEEEIEEAQAQVNIGEIAEENEEVEQEKLPTLLDAIDKSTEMLSSDKNFRKNLMTYNNAGRIKLLKQLASSTISGNEAERQARLLSLFQYTVLRIIKREVFDENGESVMPILFDISEKCKACGGSVLQIVREFADKSVSIEFIRLLRLALTLYSASDFSHPIALPLQMVAIRMLSKIRARNVTDIALGLNLCGLLLKSVRLSNRFIPEVAVYIESVLNLTLLPDERSKRILPSFRLSNLKIDISEEDESRVLDVSNPTHTSIIKTAVRLATRTASIRNIVSSQEIFRPFKSLVEEIPIDEADKREYNEAMESACNTTRTHLCKKKKVTGIKMYDPKIDFEGDARAAVSRKAKSVKRLADQLKKEKKSTLKKLKDDSRYLADQKLRKQKALDDQRKRKTKALLGSLANQEGETKAFSKKKFNLFPKL